MNATERADQAGHEATTCRYCDATISQCDLDTIWTDQLSGDDGGTYDFCVESPTHRHAPAAA